MNITINFHGDIYANIYGCPYAACDDFEDAFDYEEESEEGFEDSIPEEAEADTAPKVILCSIDSLPECFPPELAEAIAKAAVTAFVAHITGADAGTSV